jgi:tetratricopeptide (TPR) repeat protein
MITHGPQILLVVLWLGVAAAAALCAASARAVFIQRREGLAPSYRRLQVAAGGFVVILATVLWASRPVTSATSLTPRAVTADPKIAAIQADLAQRARRLEELETERARVQQEREELLGKLPAEARESELLPVDPVAERQGRLLGALVVVFALLTLGAPAVLLLGDPRSLLLRRRPPPAARALEGVDAVAQLALADRFVEAHEAALKIDDGTLDTLELLDLLYLRAHAAIMCSQDAEARKDEKASEARLAGAAKDLARLVELAPRMGEAHYLLGTLRGLQGDFEAALIAFERAEAHLAGTDLPLPHDISVCLLRLAQARLAEGKAAEATQLLDRVSKLGVLAAQIPLTTIAHGLLQVRAHLKAGRLDPAMEEIGRLRKFEDLGAERRAELRLTCDVYELLVLFHRGQHAETLATLTTFLARYVPRDLPEPDDHTADEYLFPAVDRAALPLAPELFRGFFFLSAVAHMGVVARGGKLPRDAEVDELALPLLRALQFEPRQREVLASLGALYYWCRPALREKALEWLEAAVAMGVQSNIVRGWLDRDRRRELERRDLLQAFRTTAERFFGDAMVSPRVREALLEELGRFQEFRPLLVDLERGEDAGQQSPTLAALRERAAYLQEAVADVTAMRRDATLVEAQQEYAALIAQIDQVSSRLSDLDRRVMQEMGKAVLR